MQETWFDTCVRKIFWRRDTYPLEVSWASLVSQTVKKSAAMWEIWVSSLSWEDSLEEGMETHPSILAWRIPKDRGAWQATVHEVTKNLT